MGEAERKERKRLKKLAKAAAASENVSETVITDSFLNKPNPGETEAEVKERKRLKKLAKVAAASENVSETLHTESVPNDASADVDDGSASTLSKKDRKKDENRNIPTVIGNGDMVANGVEEKENQV